MRYEKKTVILSGEGRGAVTVERSGLGVRVSFVTYGLAARQGLMAGLITPRAVIVRELPFRADPALSFFVNELDTDALHCAVFCDSLVLYGAVCRKMWESNVLGLLKARARPVKPAAAALPPLSPLPHGTPLPSTSRFSLPHYADDRIADVDFYTPFDIPARMPAVEAFLDLPRSLTLSPDPPPAPRADIYTAAPTAPLAAEPTQCAVRSDIHAEAEPVGESIAEASDLPDGGAVPEPAFDAFADTMTDDTPADAPVDASTAESVGLSEKDSKMDDTISEQPLPPERPLETPIDAAPAEPTDAAPAEPTDAAPAEPSADVCGERELPWKLHARYLSGRSTRLPVENRQSVAAVGQVNAVPVLRETEFFERCRADIEKLFAKAPADGELAGLLPDIEWVKVPFGEHYVSVGRARAFLCYAVAGTYEKASPLGAEAQWLPKFAASPVGKGYWLIFQDAVTGDIIPSV